VGVLSPGPMDTTMWLQDEVPSPYAAKRYPPRETAWHVADLIERRGVHRTSPRRFGAVAAAYPMCGPPIRWGLKRFAAADIAATRLARTHEVARTHEA
jgi:hypothetical protein